MSGNEETLEDILNEIAATAEDPANEDIHSLFASFSSIQSAAERALHKLDAIDQRLMALASFVKSVSDHRPRCGRHLCVTCMNLALQAEDLTSGK